MTAFALSILCGLTVSALLIVVVAAAILAGRCDDAQEKWMDENYGNGEWMGS